MGFQFRWNIGKADSSELLMVSRTNFVGEGDWCNDIVDFASPVQIPLDDEAVNNLMP